MTEINRRDFLAGSAAFSCYLANLLSPMSLLPALAMQPQLDWRRAPYFDLPDGVLVNIKGQNLRFGSSIYPFREPHKPELILAECAAIGFTSIRFSYPREHCQRGANDAEFNPGIYKVPDPEIAQMVRASKFEVTMTVNGHAGDEHGRPQEWPRNADGSINGRAAARSYANYMRWLVNHSKDFVQTYELWNEAFGKIDDQQYKKSFGPGGSKENADNYAAMMLPAMKEIRQLAPHSSVTIEGNYWNAPRSIGESADYQKLLSMADFVVRHPYAYEPQMYDSKTKQGKPGIYFQTNEVIRSLNPNVQWNYTEYNAGTHELGIQPEQMRGILQAKAVLRATALHLRHGICNLFVFALYYPSTPHLTLLEKDFSRRPAWLAMQRFIQACAPRRASVASTLRRLSPLPESMRDMAVATTDGFTYCIWQETDASEFKNKIQPKQVNLKLQSSGGPMRLIGVIDPISGKELNGVTAAKQEDGTLAISLPVLDYPCLCLLKAN